MSRNSVYRRAVGGLAIAGLLVLSACGDDDDDNDAGGDDDAVAAADLDGRTFRATETDGHTIVSGSEITITFTADQISVQTGCNTLAGGYTIENGRLTTGDLASTLMACEEPLATQETWVSNLIGSNPTIELDGNELELESGEDSISLTEVT
jgi:heat shock protein HslJ